MAGQFNIRQAEFGDVRELSLVLAGAFEEDPFMSWLFPESKYRFKFAQAWMRAVSYTHLTLPTILLV